MSMVVLDFAVNVAIDKAKSSSQIGVVGTFNTAQSMGACGYYIEKIGKYSYEYSYVYS